MAYEHGIYVTETPTSITAPVVADSAVIVAIGVAPVHLAAEENPTAPKLTYSLSEAKSKVGYSADEDFPLNTVTMCAYEVFGVAPVVYLNALDPRKHSVSDSELVQLESGKAVLPVPGVLLESLKLEGGGDESPSTYTLGEDYTAAYSDDGLIVITALENGALTGNEVLEAGYSVLDPEGVSEADILAAIDRVEEVYPRFGLVPGLLIAPGWSHIPAVYSKLCTMTRGLGDLFACTVLADVDLEAAPAYDKVLEWKNSNSYTDERSALCWPAARVNGKVVPLSVVLACLTARTDADNDGVPYVSPSNKAIAIQGICDGDGEEVVLDFKQANLLNGQGVNTAINLNGWRFWGNRTACYPGNTDVKDSFLATRRMFSWWGNTFILAYFQKVDDPMNTRLIEAVVDSENIRANGFKAALQIADARIEYRAEDNPQTDLLNGKIRFKMFFTPFPPAESITVDLEFDPTALNDALAG